MTEWEKHEKHDREVRAILRQTGCMDLEGRLRRFKGLETLNALAKAGHNKACFYDCQCKER